MIKLEIIKGQRGYAFDMIRDAETLGQVAFSANPDLTALFAAAPEMLELMKQVADLQNPRFNDAAYMDLVTEMDRLADLAQELLAKIEGGGK